MVQCVSEVRSGNLSVVWIAFDDIHWARWLVHEYLFGEADGWKLAMR